MNKFEQASNDGHQMLLATRDQGALYSRVPCLRGGTRDGARGPVTRDSMSGSIFNDINDKAFRNQRNKEYQLQMTFQ